MEIPVIIEAVSPPTRLLLRADGSMYGQSVIVNGIHCANSARILPTSSADTRQRREGEISFFNVDALFAEGDENIPAGVWVKCGLHYRPRIVQPRARQGRPCFEGPRPGR